MASASPLIAAPDNKLRDDHCEDLPLTSTTHSDKKPTSTMTLTDLPQELKDDIMSKLLPKAFHTAPGDASDLALKLHVDSMDALEAAYTMRSIIKLPLAVEAWIQAIKAKKIALIIIVKVPERHCYKSDIRSPRSKHSPNLLRMFKSVTLDLRSPFEHTVSSHMARYHELRVLLGIKFRHGRWVIKTVEWHRALLLGPTRPQTYEQYVPKVLDKVEQIAHGALGSCGKTYSASQLAEKLLYRLKTELEKASEEHQARVANLLKDGTSLAEAAALQFSYR